MSDWKVICRIEDIPLLGSRRVTRAQGMDVALFRTDGDQVFALLDRCPHRAGPLSQGIVFGTSVACPLHNWSIGLDDGNARAPDSGCTPRFSVRVEQGIVHLDSNELATLALDLPAPVAGPLSRFRGGANDAGRADDIPSAHRPDSAPGSSDAPKESETGRVMSAL
jgi:nitrite reductase (NADH) small subunit